MRYVMRQMVNVHRSNTGDITSLTAEYEVQKSVSKKRVTKPEKCKSAYGLCRCHFDTLCSLRFNLI